MWALKAAGSRHDIWRWSAANYGPEAPNCTYRYECAYIYLKLMILRRKR